MSTISILDNIDMFGLPVYVFNNPMHEKYKNDLLSEVEIGKTEIPVGADKDEIVNYMSGLNDTTQFIKRDSESMNCLREVLSSCLDFYYYQILKTKFESGSSWGYLRSWAISFLDLYHSRKEHKHFHGHFMSCVTAVYYLRYPEGSGAITFKNNPDRHHIFYNLTHEGLNDCKTLQPNEGNIILFPSCLLHAVEASTPESYPYRCTIVADTCPDVITTPDDLSRINSFHIERVPLTPIPK